ncbi:MAG: hypothetical protein AVDCRST_MAG25-866, partial [uncultured Rubrobacteraceae bacterium]
GWSSSKHGQHDKKEKKDENPHQSSAHHRTRSGRGFPVEPDPLPAGRSRGEAHLGPDPVLRLPRRL